MLLLCPYQLSRAYKSCAFTFFLMRKSFSPNAFVHQKLAQFRFCFHRVKIATKKGANEKYVFNSIVFRSG